MCLSSAAPRAEALHRASKDAEQGGATVVQPQNVERILPQLLLDF